MSRNGQVVHADGRTLGAWLAFYRGSRIYHAMVSGQDAAQVLHKFIYQPGVFRPIFLADLLSCILKTREQSRFWRGQIGRMRQTLRHPAVRQIGYSADTVDR